MKKKFLIILFFSFFSIFSQGQCDCTSQNSLFSIINSGSKWKVTNAYDTAINDILNFSSNGNLKITDGTAGTKNTGTYLWKRIAFDKLVISINDYMFYEFKIIEDRFFEGYLLRGSYDNSGRYLKYKMNNGIGGNGTSNGVITMQLISFNKINNDIKFKDLIKNKIESRFSEWSLQGEFEKTSDFNIRTSELGKINKIKTIEKEVFNCCSQKINVSLFSLSKYNPDQENFIIETNGYTQPLVINVPINEAKSFKLLFKDASFRNKKLIMQDDKIFISNLDIVISGKIYKYRRSSPTYKKSDVLINKKRTPKSNL
ncbi:hypothetical protein OAI16_07415 [Flavobacteriaceae bacterium]|nr:hypothetical protein [Flavobacteriaceae bacterium]